MDNSLPFRLRAGSPSAREEAAIMLEFLFSQFHAHCPLCLRSALLPASRFLSLFWDQERRRMRQRAGERAYGPHRRREGGEWCLSCGYVKTHFQEKP